MEKSCLNCRHYKDCNCYSKEFNRVVEADIIGEGVEIFDIQIESVVYITEPSEFHCCYWE